MSELYGPNPDNGEYDRWFALVHTAISPPIVPINVVTSIKRMGGYSGAALVDCDDGNRYVIKGSQVGRALVAEQLVGRLGKLMDASVAEVTLVDVPRLLIDGAKSVGRGGPGALAHFTPGIGHGSLWVENCTEERDVLFAGEGDNKIRFAGLAILFGLFLADDHQYLYKNRPPRLVRSFDHGFFLPGGPNWSIERLSSAPRAEPDAIILSAAHCGDRAVAAAIRSLDQVSDENIAAAVAALPKSWIVSKEERVALARYLARRREDLRAINPAK